MDFEVWRVASDTEKSHWRRRTHDAILLHLVVRRVGQPQRRSTAAVAATTSGAAVGRVAVRQPKVSDERLEAFVRGRLAAAAVAERRQPSPVSRVPYQDVGGLEVACVCDVL